MGENTNFRINSDGSVSVNSQPSSLEADILDIFRVEKAKGGIFCSRRMKKRAMKYAKTAGIPVHSVEKLMLDNYPNDFSNYPKTTKFIIWVVTAVIFLGGAVVCSVPAYDAYEAYSYNAKEADNAEESVKNNWGSQWHDFSDEEKRTRIALWREDSNRWANRHIKEFCWFSAYAVACLAVVGFSLHQCRRTSKSISEHADKG